MADVRSERLTVRPDQDFVVFLIGARINKWWLVPVVWAVALAMGRMMRELERDPDSGLLSHESYGGRTTLAIQYWRSLDDLIRYARDRERAHAPAWRRWVRTWGLSGAVGIWHETYVVRPGSYESLYHHMPPFGLGKVGPLVPAEGELKTARKRLAVGRRAASADSAVAADPHDRGADAA
ncbi:MAG TPA: DUF4188 domain-containing protein [Sandaracinaceae bacterium LLY-WYZ-13_1]|nr:DUF4188 domain-containing protein [Sandaracinaceae bacterium LLY-WYZ-13_1]